MYTTDGLFLLLVKTKNALSFDASYGHAGVFLSFPMGATTAAPERHYRKMILWILPPTAQLNGGRHHTGR